MKLLSKEIAIASDHAGFRLKAAVVTRLQNNGYTVRDLGTDNEEPVDYPDISFTIANYLLDNAIPGIIICGSGIGVSIAANRFSHIRAALCRNTDEAKISRLHNDANILALGARNTSTKLALEIVDAFLGSSFEGGRHKKRVEKLGGLMIAKQNKIETLQNNDKEIYDAIQKELHRQQNCIELIASENIVSQAVLEAQGSIMTNKYAEGYSGKRYYGGCEYVDIAEDLAIARVKELFNVAFANVQPHSGSQANQAVFLALLNPNDTFLGMSLNSGGHLTHGCKVNLSGKWFNPVAYDVDPKTGMIDLDQVRKLAHQHKPKLIIAGGSAYPRTIDFAGFRKIADEVGAYFMVDMAHFSGLVAGGAFPSPTPHAHVVTSTTHKTLRGPRGGIILTNDAEIAKKVNSAIFPGLQGGPLMHVIAAKAVAFGEALQPAFKIYAKHVIENAQVLANTLIKRGYTIFTGGTDCHLLLLDLRKQGLKGNAAELSLDRAGLTCNKNSIPFDSEKPTITSGIRLGTPAGTSRGFGKSEFEQVGNLVADVLDGLQKKPEDNAAAESRALKHTLGLCSKFQIYQ